MKIRIRNSSMYVFYENKLRNRLMYFFSIKIEIRNRLMYMFMKIAEIQMRKGRDILPMPNQIRLILLVARPSIALPLPRWSTEMKNCHSNHNEFVAAASYLCHLAQVDRSQFYSDASIYIILNKPMSFDGSSKHLC